MHTPPKRTTEAPPRRKSCAVCIKTKRRCDQRLPACSRCVARHIQCTYPSLSLGRDGASSTASPSQNLRPQQSTEEDPRPTPVISKDRPQAISDAPVSPFSTSWDSLFQSWTSFNAEGFHHYDLYSAERVDMQAIPFSNSPLPSQSKLSLTCRMALNNYPISSSEMARMPGDRHEYALNKLKSYPHNFAKTGGTSFIPMRLYEDGLPQPLRDAFCACSTYCTRSDQTTRISFQILDFTADSLVALKESWTVAEHLATLQALLLIQIIRLFDGDIHQRTVAEEHGIILKQWTDQLLSRFEGEECNSTDVVCPSPNWQTWLFGESVRRTLIVSFLLQSIYSVCKTGTCCSRGEIDSIKFTAASSLWGAPSAWHWLRAWDGKNHWNVSMMNFDGILKDANRSDVDDFGVMMLIIYRGLDSVRDWLAKTSEESAPSTPS
ncbi:hypothetical protein F5884DRAFT_304382 [Xylogone sp. PMI_703]|nr:hypothetical protein F5884DRAFT_304382 [Xylogone sp. PMI_703]